MKRCAALVIALVVMMGFCARVWADVETSGPAQVVLAYLNALKSGDIQGAKRFLADPETLDAWTLGKRMEVLGYPSLKQVEAVQVQETREGARVVVRCWYLDMARVFLDIDVVDFYSATVPYYTAGFEQWLDETMQDNEKRIAFWELAERYEKSEDITYRCVKQGGVWRVDLTGTVASWRADAPPFDLRVASWGRITPDYATRRYNVNESNVWLRLDSTAPRVLLETLVDFCVAVGDASCDSLPVPLDSCGFGGMAWMTLHFAPKDGFSRGALEISLAAGEDIGRVVLACTRRVNDLAFNYYEDTIALPLQGLKEDAGYPRGGAVFQALCMRPFERNEEAERYFEKRNGRPSTIEEVLRREAFGMPDVPEEVLALPDDAEEYQFYLVEGDIVKKPGSFGVYDVMFQLSNKPEGVYASIYEACGMCDEIDGFDMLGNDVYRPNGLLDVYDDYYRQMPENLKGAFRVLLLVKTRGRSQEQIEALIKGLDISATFSGEKWNMSYEQHGTTSGIGPRSMEKVHMEGLVASGD